MVKVTGIEITTTYAGSTKTTNVNYVNEQATNEKIRQFAQMLVNLTDEIYQFTTKITREKVI